MCRYPSASGQPTAPSADAGPASTETPDAIVLGSPVVVHGEEVLTEVVLGRLLAEFGRAQGVVATDDEVQQLAERLDRDLEKSLLPKLSDRRDTLRAQLAHPDLRDFDRADAQHELDGVEAAIADFESAPVAGEPRECALARRQIVGFKTRRAIYERYGGGHVRVRAYAPTPIDATRRFLREAEAKRSFTIVNPGVRTDFWRAVDDDYGHRFYGPEDAKQVMSTPWWQLPDPTFG